MIPFFAFALLIGAAVTLAVVGPSSAGAASVSTTKPVGRLYLVNQKHPQARDDNAGTEEAPFKTISRASLLAQAGDTILVREGVYRERVIPARGGEQGRPIRYLAAPGETVAVKGSELWQPAWQAVEAQADVYRAALDDALFAGQMNPYRLAQKGYDDHPVRPATGESLEATRGQIFVEGQPLTQVETLAELYAVEGTWRVAADGKSIEVHFSPSCPSRTPAERKVELTVRHRIFAPEKRHLGHIQVRGFVFEHCANNHPTPQIGAVSTRTGHHWVIEDCVIRYANTVGLDIGSEWGISKTPEAGDWPPHGDFASVPDGTVGHTIVRNNVISDNGLGGMFGIMTWGCRIENNVLERNNRLGFRTWEVGAIKVHHFFDGVIEGNLIRDNDCFGIWLDNRYRGSRVTRNLVLNNHMAGIMVELGLGPVLVDNNVVAYTRSGDGLYSHDASGVTVAHNLFYANANWGVFMAVGTDRCAQDGKPVRSSSNCVLNNMLLGNKLGAVSLPFPWERASDNQSDANLVMGAGETMDESTGVVPPLFMLNTSHQHVKVDQIASAFARTMDEHQIPAEDRPNLKGWKEQAFLNLEQWRLLSGGYDLKSRTIKLYHEMLASRTCEYSMKLDQTPWQVRCAPVNGVDRDYLGRQIPNDRPLLPGPFQHLMVGNNRITLWPMHDASRLPALPPWNPDLPAATPEQKKDFSSTGI